MNENKCYSFNTDNLTEKIITFKEYEKKFNPSINLFTRPHCTFAYTFDEYNAQKNQLIISKKYNDFIADKINKHLSEMVRSKNNLEYHNASFYTELMNMYQYKYPIDSEHFKTECLINNCK